LEPALNKELLVSLDRLPAMPQVAVRLLGALGDEDSTATDLEKIIGSDAALAAKMLSLASSAYYGFTQPVTTVRRAVVAIGFREIRLLALGASLASVFDPSQMPRGFDGEGLWIHSLAVSLASCELAERVHHRHPGELQAAGLLHDLGKLAAAVCFKDKTTELMARVKNGEAYHQAENELGINHSQIGYQLAHHWGLAELHYSAIRDHHQPAGERPFNLETCLVSLADRIIKELQYGSVDQSPALDPRPLIRETGLKKARYLEARRHIAKTLPPMLEAWREIL